MRDPANRPRAATFWGVRCPKCGYEATNVIDSRVVQGGSATRRRRVCQECSGRFTTFERVELTPVVVVKRSGDREQFDRRKILDGLVSAAKGRPLDQERFEALADDVEDAARAVDAEVSSTWVGLAVLERLRQLDEVTYLRFASVYKNFEAIDDFEREASLIKLSDA